MRIEKLFSILFDGVAAYVIWNIVTPIGRWYLEKTPIRGADTLLSAVYLNYIYKWHEFIGPLGWKYIWFGGNPLPFDSSFFFLLMVPLVKVWGVVGVLMHSAIFALFIFALFCYLFFSELSKNKGLALFLTVVILLFSNLYIALVFSGDIPFWISYAFLPLVGFLIVKFLNTNKSRFLTLATLTSGLGALGNQQGFIYGIIPFCSLILLFYNPMNFRIGRRFLGVLFYLLLVFLVSLPQVIFDLRPHLGAKSSFALLGEGPILWLFLGIIGIIWCFFLVFLIKSRKRLVLNALPFVIFLAFAVGLGIVFEYKFLYLIPFAAGSLTAILFRQSLSSLEKFKFFQKQTVLVLINIVFLVFLFVYFPQVRVKDFITTLENFSAQSPSIFVERVEVPEQLNDKNKRVYALDHRVNTFLSMNSDMPLAGGLVEPRINARQKWGLFWLESIFSPSEKSRKSSLISDWNISDSVVDQNIRFLLDWNGIYYLADRNVPPAKGSLAVNVIDSAYIDNVNTVSDINYFKIKEELTTPILTPNSASAVLLVGDLSAYETIYRFLGMMNLNSRKLIVANNSKYIDDFSQNDFSKFDCVILYRYDYRNRSKAWELVEKYLQDGGKVYIDTGSEGNEAANNNLPDFFPVRRTVRDDIGVNWDVKSYDEKLTKNVDFDAFSPLDFDGEAWNVSHPKEEKDLNSGAHVILKNNDIIISASKDVGSGKLIWTGFNLPYHIIRDYNEQESNFFYNLISELVDTSEKTVSNIDYKWISPERREIKIGGARAVLFKEEDFGGWQARSDTGLKLKIYKAGPAYPGFMYVPFEKGEIPHSVIFSYKGQLRFWIFSLVSVLSIIFLVTRMIKER